MRQALRTATADCHSRVDAVFSRLDLNDAEAYGRFLRAQAAAFLPIEDALCAAGAGKLIAGWEDRRRAPLLRDDLADLGEDIPAPLPVPPFAEPAAILGMAYVLDGSRLGGTLLRREVRPGLPTRFLDTEAGPAWRATLSALESGLAGEGDLTAAIQAAQSAFDLFERSGTDLLKATPA